MSTMEISVLIIAIAFVVLVIFLSFVLIATVKLIKQLTKTVSTVDETIKEMTDEGMYLIQDINEKVSALNPFFQTLSLLGERLKEKTENWENREEVVFEEEREKKSKLTNILEWVALGFSLWSQAKKRR